MRGWCPGVFAPMRQADGWLMRIKPPCATLRASAARILARIARDHGDGTIALTSRGNVQVRALSHEATGPVARMLVEAGLANPDPDIERRRAVIFPPLAGPHELAVAIESALCREDLPHKFCLAVDADEHLPLGDTGADITVVCVESRCAVALAGAARAASVRPDQARDAVTHLARVLAASGARRMRAFVVERGAESVFAAAQLHADLPAPVRPARNPIGWLAHIGAFGIGLPRAYISAEALSALAAAAERWGDATLRTTPWRALLLPGIGDPSAVRAAVEPLDLIADPADAGAAMLDLGAFGTTRGWHDTFSRTIPHPDPPI